MRLVVWGLGGHAIEKILPAVSAASGLELYGVCSRNPTTVADCSSAWKCRGWTDATAMLSDPNVEIVYLATPIGLHAEQGRAVLRAHKHFWSEKAFTSRLSETLGLLELSRQLRLSACETHMYLHHPQFARLSQRVLDGGLGKILSVSCRFGVPKLDRPGFRTDRLLGGGALFDVGAYPISAIQALFPNETETLLWAATASRDGSLVDTDGACVVRLSNDVEAILEWRTNAAYRNEIDIWGESGSLSTERLFSKAAEYRPFLRLRDSHGVETIEHVDAADHFVIMLENFRMSIANEQAMESQRNAIARRARLLDEIVTRTT